MSHARRYFKEALPTAAVPCAQALALIGQLYRIERAASDTRLDAPARQRLRQEQALPLLAKLQGYLQVDAAPAYDDVFAQYPGIIEVGCWAHARRYFKEAMPTAAVPCAQALAIIRRLYGIERAASDRQLDAPARQGLR